MVEISSEVGIGDECIGNEVNVSKVEVSMVDEIMVEVRIVDVSRVEVTMTSLFCTPSPLLTFFSLSDKLTGMFGVRTSFV